jgi:hypothetical protein
MICTFWYFIIYQLYILYFICKILINTWYYFAYFLIFNQKLYQKICQKLYQIECQKACQIFCQKISQTIHQKVCWTICQNVCRTICQNVCWGKCLINEGGFDTAKGIRLWHFFQHLFLQYTVEKHNFSWGFSDTIVSKYCRYMCRNIVDICVEILSIYVSKSRPLFGSVM